MALSSAIGGSGKEPVLEETSLRLRTVLDVFRCMTGESFLAQLRVAIALLSSSNPKDGFSGVATALEKIELTLQNGAKEIKGFLAAYQAIPSASNASLDETELLQYLRLTDDDIEFLIHAGETCRQAAGLLHECSCACRRDILSISEVSDTAKHSATVVSSKASEFPNTERFVLRLLSKMWTPGRSVDQQGKIVPGFNTLTTRLGVSL